MEVLSLSVEGWFRLRVVRASDERAGLDVDPVGRERTGQLPAEHWTLVGRVGEDERPTERPGAVCTWSVCGAPASHEVLVQPLSTGAQAAWLPRCEEHRQLEDSGTLLTEVRELGAAPAEPTEGAGLDEVAAVVVEACHHLDAARRALVDGIAKLRKRGVVGAAAVCVSVSLDGLLAGVSEGLVAAEWGDVLPPGGGV